MADEANTTTEKPFKFTLKRHTEEVTIEVEDKGDRKFLLREMSGFERDGFLDTQQKRAKFDGSGKPVGITTIVNIQADLITRCLVDVDGTFGDPGKLVTLDKVKDFPASLQDALFKKLQKINKLEKEAQEEVKKD